MLKFLITGTAVILLVAVGSVPARALTDGGDTYTGCLTEGGSLINVALGEMPARPCNSNQTQISWQQQGPGGEPGPPGVTKVFGTEIGYTIIQPGDPPVDFMALDLPAGNYFMIISIFAGPELLPGGWGPGGSLDCRFFEEAADGSRRDLTGIKFGALNVGIQGPEEGHDHFVFPATLIDHPDDTRIVLVCQHNWGKTLQVFYARWNALTVGMVEHQ